MDLTDGFNVMVFCPARAEYKLLKPGFFINPAVFQVNQSKSKRRRERLVVFEAKHMIQGEPKRLHDLASSNGTRAMLMVMAGIEPKEVADDSFADQLSVMSRATRAKHLVDVIPKLLTSDKAKPDAENAMARALLETCTTALCSVERPVASYGTVLKILQRLMSKVYTSMHRALNEKRRGGDPVARFSIQAGSGDMLNLFIMMKTSDLIHVGDTEAYAPNQRGAGKAVFMANSLDQLLGIFDPGLLPQHILWYQRVHYLKHTGSVWPDSVKCRIGLPLGENDSIVVRDNAHVDSLCAHPRPDNELAGHRNKWAGQVLASPRQAKYKEQLGECALMELNIPGNTNSDADLHNLMSTYSKEKLVLMIEQSRLKSKSYIGFHRLYKVMVQHRGDPSSPNNTTHPFLLRMSREGTASGEFIRTLHVC